MINFEDELDSDGLESLSGFLDRIENALAILLDAEVDGRELALVKTKLQEAALWAKEALLNK